MVVLVTLNRGVVSVCVCVFLGGVRGVPGRSETTCSTFAAGGSPRNWEPKQVWLNGVFFTLSL